MKQRFAALQVEGTCARPQLFTLLQYMREQMNFEEEFPDEEELTEHDVDEMLEELDFESTGLGILGDMHDLPMVLRNG